MHTNNNIIQKIFGLMALVFIISSCGGDDEVTPIIPTITVLLDREIVEPGDDISFTSIISEASSIRWDFGDGNFSDDENPTHAYDEPGEYNVVATVTSSTGDTQSANVTAVVGERVFAGFVVNAISETDESGAAWDTDGSGPELYFGFTPQSSQAGIDLYPLGTDVTNTSIAATEFGGLGGILPENDRLLFSNELWDFILIDDDDPLGQFDQNEIMAVFTLNPVIAPREELNFDNGQGIILIEESGYTIRILYLLQAP